MAFSPQGRFLVVGPDRGLVVYSVLSGQVVQILEEGCWTTDGDMWLDASRRDGKIDLWRVSDDCNI